MRSSKELAEAVLVWRKQPARVRENLFHFFLDEAVQADDRVRHEQSMGRGRREECRYHRKEAAILRAALGVLQAVSPKRVASTKRARRRA
jgi:hypothetical protein